MPGKVSRKIFYSKVLLFGEQIINKGALGLAMPFEHFEGMLKAAGDLSVPGIRKSNKALEAVAHHILHHNTLAPLYDTNRFLTDIEDGLYFDSNIPQGFGLGSSGALLAAVYHQYRVNKRKNTPISDLKNELAALENIFHCASSGLDPLVSYLHKTLLIRNGNISETQQLPKVSNPAVSLFLINTHIERKTSLYVKLFLQKCEAPKFTVTLEKSLIPASNIAAESFLKRRYSQLMKCIKLISQLQMDLMPEFIPDRFREVWHQGLKHNEYHLKLCGAGGGGFIIGIAKADSNLSLILGAADIIEIMKF